MDEKKFTDYLAYYQDVTSNLTDLLAIAERIQRQKDFSGVELINCMKKEIESHCSKEFVALMKQEVSKELKNINSFSGEKTNLDYLVEVIYQSLTKSPYVIGYQHFIAPGKTYEESGEFCSKFFRDFIKVKELFRVGLREVKEVTIGYAMEFYLP